MTEKDQDNGGNFLDYLPYIMGCLFILFFIYLFLSENKTESMQEMISGMYMGSPPEYHISSAFGIAR